MNLKKHQNRSRLRASFLLFIFLFDLFRPYLLQAKPGMSGDAPVASSASDMVDPFTGGFHYSVPLMVVPGPNGESVDISASYRAGIAVDQKASWIGLGWDYNPGEISRQINGVGDDAKGGNVLDYSFFDILNTYSTSKGSENNIFGPLYYTNFPATSANYISGSAYSANNYKSCDVFIDEAPSDRADIAALPFRIPAYDKFMVSGPGIGGRIRPVLPSASNLALSKAPSYSLSTYISKPQFIFENSSAFDYPADEDESYSVFGNSNYYDPANTRVIQGYYIRYFTNNDINGTNGNILYDNSTHTGFLDYQVVTGTRRPSSNSANDPTGVGGFQITNPQGITYHYSLPVYTWNQFSISFGLHNDGTADLTRSIDRNQKAFNYATSWKLTAVTGSDYEDTDNNHMVNQGDKGYWIAYNYSLWTSVYNWRFPFFNYKQDMSMAGFPTMGASKVNSNNESVSMGTYAPQGSATQGTNQVYYLDNIQTATHTAFFVKDLRLDEHSSDHVLNTSNNPVPLLKLNRIILMRNEDAGLLANNGSFPGNTNFDLSNCNTSSSGNPTLAHIGTYNSNATNIDLKTLKSVVFNTDYSLCQKLPNNINNSFTINNYSFSNRQAGYGINNYGSVVYNNEAAVFTGINGSLNMYAYPSSPSYAISNGGKLTLNEILTYENGNTKVFPSYKFTYSNNQDYDQNKTDLWGYYNPNYQAGYSHYNLTGSGPDAWSLTKITTPLGGEVNITYEPDSYSSQFTNSTQFGLSTQPPSYIFLITSAQNGCTPGTLSALYHMADRQFGIMQGDFASFFNACTTRNLFLPTKTSCVATTQQPEYYGYIQGSISSLGTGTNPPYNFTFSSPGLSLSGYAGTLGYNCNMNTSSPVTECAAYGGSTYYPQTRYSAYDPMAYGYGYIQMPVSSMYGGGIRVNNIQVRDPQTNSAYKQTYTYYGGTASANPDRIAIRDNGVFLNNSLADPFAEPPVVEYNKIEVQTIVGSTSQNNGKTVYEYSTESTLPFYKYDHNGGGQVPLSSGTTSCCSNGSYHYTFFGYGLTKTTDHIGHLGKPTKISSYDNNGQLIAYTKYKYVSSNMISESFSNVNDYRDPDHTAATLLSSYTIFCNGTANNSCIPVWTRPTFYLSTYIHDYSVFLYSTETFKDGITTRQTILGRDPYTSAPTQVLTEDPTKGAYLNTTQYAYTLSPSYASMGLKGCSGCLNNQNNLMNVSETHLIKYPMSLTANGTLGADRANPGYLIGGSKNTFTNQVPYRTLSSGHFINSAQSKLFWKPFESYQLSVDANTLETATPVWRKTSTATSYNASRNSIQEAKGLNGRYSSAVKLGYNDQYKIADISDASLDCFAFSSFEDGALAGNTTSYYGGEINNAGMQKMTPFVQSIIAGLSVLNYTVRAHTGNYVAQVPAGSFGPTFSTINFELGRTYRASAWINVAGSQNVDLKATLDGTFASGNSPITVVTNSSSSNNTTVGTWKLMTVDITVPTNYAASGGALGQNDLRFFIQNNDTQYPVHVDDLSIHPIDAPITGYVYNPATGWVIATLDNENFATYYTYDEAGRVINVQKETKNGTKKISETVYHFGRP